MSPLRRSKREPGPAAVRAEALVLEGDSGISGTTSWLSLVDLLVTIPGRPPMQVRYEGMVDRDKELVTGFVVPVDVDPSDPTKLEFRWDEIPTIAERVANRDPVVIDPEAAWRKVQDTWHQLNPMRPTRPTPWGNGQIDGWPTTEELKGGRQPGTAWIISQSADARSCTNGDSVMPPGRSHYRYRGTVSYGPHTFMSWMLLCVIPQYGERYGVRLRTNVVRWRNTPVLPVAINPDKPADIEFCWDNATSLAHLIAERIDTGIAEFHTQVDTMRAVEQSATSQALANVADPAARAQATQLLEKLGVATTDPSRSPVAAAPSSGLERLERLRSSGVLTDAEFESERAKLTKES